MNSSNAAVVVSVIFSRQQLVQIIAIIHNVKMVYDISAIWDLCSSQFTYSLGLHWVLIQCRYWCINCVYSKETIQQLRHNAIRHVLNPDGLLYNTNLDLPPMPPIQMSTTSICCIHVGKCAYIRTFNRVIFSR